VLEHLSTESPIRAQISAVINMSNSDAAPVKDAPPVKDASPAKDPPNRAAARQQVWVGFGIVCRATLILQAVVKQYTYRPSKVVADEASLPVLAEPSLPSISSLSKAQFDTILSKIVELSKLVQDNTARLDKINSGRKCNSLKLNMNTYTFAGACVSNKQDSPDVAEILATLVGTLSSMLLPVGIIIISTGLSNLSETLRNRSWAFGLLGANIGLAISLAIPPTDWVDFFPRTSVAFYTGMLGGILSDLKTFLSD
jgi:hypothetical protein